MYTLYFDEYILHWKMFVVKFVGIIEFVCFFMRISVAARSKAWVCGRSLAGIAALNSAGGMDVCLL